jgi:ATP-dependent helicase YprA (DUF1998 family)
MSEVQSVIDAATEILRGFPGVVFHHDPPPTPVTAGTFSSLDDIALDPQLTSQLRSDYPQGLYRHQAIALLHILNGENTVVATRTSSGKSLIYYAPVFDSLLRNENATALFIYPQKALANDQLGKLQSFGARPLCVRMSETIPCR